MTVCSSKTWLISEQYHHSSTHSLCLNVQLSLPLVGSKKIISVQMGKNKQTKKQQHCIDTDLRADQTLKAEYQTKLILRKQTKHTGDRYNVDCIQHHKYELCRCRTRLKFFFNPHFLFWPVSFFKASLPLL